MYPATQFFYRSFGFSLVLFAGFCGLRSDLIPRPIGAMMILAGVCYVINTLAMILSPEFTTRINPAVLLPCLLAELLPTLWLFNGQTSAGQTKNRWPRSIAPA